MITTKRLTGLCNHQPACSLVNPTHAIGWRDCAKSVLNDIDKPVVVDELLAGDNGLDLAEDVLGDVQPW